jgi:glutaredoxin-like protein
MSDNLITVYGTNRCGDCRRAKKFLSNHSIPFNWIDIDTDSSAESIVRNVNGGLRSVPTIIFADGTALVEPSNRQLSRKLGLKF